MPHARTALVYGAYGHTGRFVVAELGRRGLTAILAGRDAEKLETLGESFPGLERRLASVDDPPSLERAAAGAAVILNCAGPFARTAAPLVETALRAGVPYLDVAAEVEAVLDTFERDGERARAAGLAVLPAAAFYGGLGDLVASAAMGDWNAADEISLAYALSSWRPTLGTRATGAFSRARRRGRRIAFANGRLETRTDAPPKLAWQFAAPFGAQTVVGEFTTADSVTIPRHLRTAQLRTVMTLAPLADLEHPDPAPPPAVDASGRSDQTFQVEVRVRRGDEERLAIARGRDIYAITAPLLVEAATRLVSNGRAARGAGGVFSLGEIFDAREFLGALAPEPLAVELPDGVLAEA